MPRRSRLATTARSASAVVLERSFPKAGLPRPCETHFSFLRFATIQQCDRKFATQVPISRGYEATVPQISSLSTRTHASYCVLFSRHRHSASVLLAATVLGTLLPVSGEPNQCRSRPPV